METQKKREQDKEAKKKRREGGRRRRRFRNVHDLHACIGTLVAMDMVLTAGHSSPRQVFQGTDPPTPSRRMTTSSSKGWWYIPNTPALSRKVLG